jgi:hypothetical protein
MKLTLRVGIGIIAALAMAASEIPAAEPTVNISPVVLEGLSSTKDHGVVKVMSDPSLAGGRLVLKVVAFNRTAVAASFGPEDVKVFTAAGQEIPLMSLEQLVQETRAAAASGANAPPSVDTFGTSGPTITHDMAGRPDVGNYTAGSNSMGTGVSTRGRRGSHVKGDDAKLVQQIADLTAAMLKPLTIAPASAAGGEIVTQKIKLGRKEARVLRVVVEFNGEQHEFDFAAPPEQ